jgi:2'-5' RNA ligase
MPTLRLFIATEISDAQRKATLELMANLQKGIQFTRSHPKWVEPESLHLTLKFLGGVEQERVDAIVQAVEVKLLDRAPFKMSLRGLGTFPDERAPKVLWLGVDQGKRDLMELAQRIESALYPIGFTPDLRAFHPHLTLARIKSLSGIEAMMSVIESHRRAEPGGEARVESVSLYKSDLLSEGPAHTVLHRWPLLPVGAAGK